MTTHDQIREIALQGLKDTTFDFKTVESIIEASGRFTVKVSCCKSQEKLARIFAEADPKQLADLKILYSEPSIAILTIVDGKVIDLEWEGIQFS